MDISKKYNQSKLYMFEMTTGKYMYMIFHMVMSFVAVYLSYMCNKEFNMLSFAGAIFFPYLYIIYTLSTKGTCGIIEKK